MKDIQFKLKPVLLLVDDNEEILEILEEDLSGKYQVLTANDGEEAYDILTSEIAHLIVSDVMMPNMDGFEFCSKVKTNFELSHIPFILLTAKDTLQSKIEGLKLGADAYIEKPFSTDYLYTQIENLISNRVKIKEYFAKSPSVHINTMAYSKDDEIFLEKLNTLILEHLDAPGINIENLAAAFNMSRITFYRKIKSLSGMSPHQLVNVTRLKKAAEMMSKGNLRINEIAYTVGYGSQSQFGRNFQKQFNMKPTDYIKKIKTHPDLIKL